MKKLIIPSLFCLALVFASCSSKKCKECTSCQTKPNATLCEGDFQTVNDYNDQVQNYESDGCICKSK